VISLLPILIQHSGSEAGGDEGHGGASVFDHLFAHVIPQETGLGLWGLPIYNIQIVQVLAMILIVAIFLRVPQAIRTGGGGFLARTAAGTVAWLRDSVVVPNLGASAGRMMLPYFCSLFFFLLFMNLLGLVPKSVTPTANVFVTAALACLTLIMMVVGGMIVQGPIAFWKHLVPPGVPGWLAPLLFLLEVMGLVIKPFALTMRLMGNMMGGHLALLAFLGLLFYFGQDSTAVGLGLSLPVVGLSVFMMLIEGFVALLQAYVFTILSVIFVGMCLHPQH
jgi:F-type H+-transporting ATPase subunit a